MNKSQKVKKALEQMYDLIQDIGTSQEDPVESILKILKGKDVKEIKKILQTSLTKAEETSILQ